MVGLANFVFNKDKYWLRWLNGSHCDRHSIHNMWSQKPKLHDRNIRTGFILWHLWMPLTSMLSQAVVALFVGIFRSLATELTVFTFPSKPTPLHREPSLLSFLLMWRNGTCGGKRWSSPVDMWQWLTFLKPVLFEKLNISQCSGLDVNAPTSFCVWISGPPVGGAIWGGLGDVALTDEASHWRWALIALGPTLFPVPLQACGWVASSQLPAKADRSTAMLSLTV